jgi:hypothetical protein
MTGIIFRVSFIRFTVRLSIENGLHKRCQKLCDVITCSIFGDRAEELTNVALLKTCHSVETGPQNDQEAWEDKRGEKFLGV